MLSSRHASRTTIRIHALLLGLALALSAVFPAQAEDTDIYLRPALVTNVTKPQLLIIFGNSASMDHVTVTETVSYDPDQTYGNGENDFETDKLYWCLVEGSGPAACKTNNPSPAGPNMPFDIVTVTPDAVPYKLGADANHCQSTATLLATKGEAVALNAAARKYNVATGGKGQWQHPDQFAPLVDGGQAIDFIECSNDASTATIEPGEQTYANGEIASSGYTNAANKALNWDELPTVRFFTGNYLNYLNEPPGLTTTKTRLQVAADAVKDLIDNIGETMDIGLMAFNKNWDGEELNTAPHGGRVLLKIDAMTAARRTLMKAYVDMLSGHPTDPDMSEDPHVPNVYAEPEPFSEDKHAVNPAPLAETFWEAIQYIGGKLVDYGDDDNTDALGTFATAVGTGPFTDPDSVTFTPPRDLTAETAATGLPNYISPFSIQCQQVYILYVTDGVVKEGADDNASGEDRYGSLPILDAEQHPLKPIVGNALDEMANWAFHNDVYDGIDELQRAVTYVVGVDVPADAAPESTESFLKSVAKEGAGLYFSGNSASRLLDGLRSAVLDIRATVRSFAAPTLSVNAFNKLFNRDEVYFAVFRPTANNTRWLGNIKKFALCNAEQDAAGACEFGEVVYCPGRVPGCSNPRPAIDPQTLRISDHAESFWGSGPPDGGRVVRGGAGEVLKSVVSDGARRLYTFYGDYTNVSYPLVLNNNAYKVMPATPSGLYVDAVGDGTNTPDPSLVGASTTAEAEKVIKWMYGIDVYDEDEDGDFTEPRWAYADPLHSRPVAITFGAVPCTSTEVADDTHPCYGRDLSDTSIEHPNPRKPVIKLFVATNDGVIRMINDANGKEEWAFVPKEMLGLQKTLAENPSLGGVHTYGVDGTPTFWVNDENDDGVIDCGDCDGIVEDGEDFVYMFVGMRRGGNNVYAFDVTPIQKLEDPQAVNTVEPKLLWVIRGGTDPYQRLAQTWAQAQVASIRVCKSTGNCKTDGTEPKTVLILPGGYNASQQDQTTFTNEARQDTVGNVIYIIDPDPGELDSNKHPDVLAFIGGPDGDADNTNDPAPKFDAMTFSIPMDVALMDANRDGEIDRMVFADVGGQVWRVDLGPDLALGDADVADTTGAVLADLACPPTAGNRPGCAENLADPDDYEFVQQRRKFMHQVDVAQLRDTQYSQGQFSYDVVTLVSGDRADPNDRHTEGRLTGGVPDPVQAVNNRIYVIRDYLIDQTIAADGSNFPLCLDSSDDSVKLCETISGHPDAIVEGDLLDVTNQANATEANLKDSTGWYISLKEDTAEEVIETGGTDVWVGEKGLATPVIFDFTVFATTYKPASNATADVTCSATEGLGKLYALNIFTGDPQFDFDTGVAGNERTLEVGGGIPSELVVVIREGGVSGLVGVSGGTRTTTLSETTPRGRTFWFQGDGSGNLGP